MVQTRAIRRRCEFIATYLCEIVRRAPEEGFGVYDPEFWREWHEHLCEAMTDPQWMLLHNPFSGWPIY
jgi:hypothetical protein